MAAEGGLEGLLWHWLLWLDPASLSQAKAAGLVSSLDIEEQVWQHLCAVELGVPASRLTLTGSVPSAPRGQVARWRRTFFDLDVAGLRNRLRRSKDDYAFLPSLYGEAPEAPDGVRFFAGADSTASSSSSGGADPATCCQLDGECGRSRCVISQAPLPSILAATAVPAPPATDGASNGCDWRVGYRLAGYYEVTLGPPRSSESAPPQPPSGATTPCVTVGLCTPRLSRRAAGHQQAGLDVESWALRSSDGLLYHGSAEGKPLPEVEPLTALRGERRPAVGEGAAGRRRRAPFGEGDTVGCGIAHLLPISKGPTREDAGATTLPEGLRGLEAGIRPLRRHDLTGLSRTLRRVFFTLNGELLGAPWLVDDTPPNVPLWPCVGIDAPWLLSFNFGQRPFAFDLDAALPPLEVPLASPYDTLEEWPAEVQVRPIAEDHVRHPRLMPLTSKVAGRRFLGSWTSTPVWEAVRKYATHPRWLDPIDRLVSNRMARHAPDVLMAAIRARSRRGLAWLENLGVQGQLGVAADGRGVGSQLNIPPFPRPLDHSRRLAFPSWVGPAAAGEAGGSSRSSSASGSGGGGGSGGAPASAHGHGGSRGSSPGSSGEEEASSRGGSPERGAGSGSSGSSTGLGCALVASQLPGVVNAGEAAAGSPAAEEELGADVGEGSTGRHADAEETGSEAGAVDPGAV